MQDMRPGFHRRIKLHPFPNRIAAGLADNLHRFDVTLAHAGGIINDAVMAADRYPWTTCADAPDFLRQQLIGRRLGDLQQMDCLSHCTHLFELAILCASHADDVIPLQFDLHVDEWNDSATRVELFQDGTPTLCLEVKNRLVETPGEWFGRDLLHTSDWQPGLNAAQREQAMLISRAIYVSLGRAAPVVQRATERGSRALGVCFTYQPSRVGQAIQMPHSRREFDPDTGTVTLLEDFTP